MEADVMAGAFLDLGSKVDKVSRQVSEYGVKPIHKTVFGVGYSIASGLGDYALVEVSQWPAQGRIWVLRAFTLMSGQPGSATGLTQNAAGSYQVGQYASVFSTAVAAAAAGSLTVTSSYLSGFRIDPAAAWPAGLNQVTVTNLLGGTKTYDLPGGTTNPLIEKFTNPVPAPFGNPVISVPAIVGGPAFTINADGQNLGNNVINTAVDLYAGVPPQDGRPITATGSAPDIAGLIRPNLGPLPYFDEITDEVYFIRSSEKLYGIFSQVPSGGTMCVIVARIDDYPENAIEGEKL